MLPVRALWPIETLGDTFKLPSPPKRAQPLSPSNLAFLLDSAMLWGAQSHIQQSQGFLTKFFLYWFLLWSHFSYISPQISQAWKKVWSSRKKIWYFWEKIHQNYFYILTLWINKFILLLNKNKKSLSFVFHFMYHTHLYILLFFSCLISPFSPLTRPTDFILGVLWGVKES